MICYILVTDKKPSLKGGNLLDPIGIFIEYPDRSEMPVFSILCVLGLIFIEISKAVDMKMPVHPSPHPKGEGARQPFSSG